MILATKTRHANAAQLWVSLQCHPFCYVQSLHRPLASNYAFRLRGKSSGKVKQPVRRLKLLPNQSLSSYLVSKEKLRKEHVIQNICCQRDRVKMLGLETLRLDLRFSPFKGHRICFHVLFSLNMKLWYPLVLLALTLYYLFPAVLLLLLYKSFTNE